MKKLIHICMLPVLSILMLSACGSAAQTIAAASPEALASGINHSIQSADDSFVTFSTETYWGFTIDNVLHAGEAGDIHYNVYIPESYDGSEPYALFFTLPGNEGLYFQGVAANLQSEEFGFEAQKYHEEYDRRCAPAQRLAGDLCQSDHRPGGVFFETL